MNDNLSLANGQPTSSQILTTAHAFFACTQIIVLRFQSNAIFAVHGGALQAIRGEKNSQGKHRKVREPTATTRTALM
jgi:hypothetical protein